MVVSVVFSQPQQLCPVACLGCCRLVPAPLSSTAMIIFDTSCRFPYGRAFEKHYSTHWVWVGVEKKSSPAEIPMNGKDEHRWWSFW